MGKATSKPRKPTKSARSADKPCCGLCGKSKQLARTECCGNWICDDEHNYVLFSYAQNSCRRNHSRYTLCALHFNEGHSGDWKTCKKCKAGIETEMYVWYGTNEHNFEKLVDPPAYKPTKCNTCGKVIRLGEGGYSISGEKYFCMKCGGLPGFLRS